MMSPLGARLLRQHSQSTLRLIILLEDALARKEAASVFDRSRRPYLPVWRVRRQRAAGESHATACL